jgi:uncharacterized damage-inducible protein DinB
MSITAALLGEFEHEAATTRKFLAAIPPDKLSWRPHAKSHTLGELASHIARLPGGILEMALADQAAIPDEKTLFAPAAGVPQLLALHDQSVEKVRKILPTLDDAALQSNWTALVGGQPVMTMPRAMVLRIVMMNHWIHHRGQLGVYLRLAGAKVPGSYGPSGDE